MTTDTPRRQTRRLIAKVSLAALVAIVFVGLTTVAGDFDLGDNALEILKVAAGTLGLVLSAFIAEQGFSDDSERKAEK